MMRSAPPNYLPVVAAAIFGPDGRLLLSRRHAHVHQGDLWEFPGGKLEPGETARQGLVRELEEELGIRVDRCSPLIQIPHTYPERPVWLDVWRVDGYSGQPEGREGQAVDWFDPTELATLPMPPANRPIVNALKLPSLLAITPPVGSPAELLAQAAAALRRGVGAIQLRRPDLPDSVLLGLAGELSALCRAHGAICFLNAAPGLLAASGAQGLHLGSRRLRNLDRRPVGSGTLVSAACHDLADLRRAAAVEADCVLLSPVNATASHPLARPLGWRRFAELCRVSRMPVYALGGLGATDLGQARDMGGQGVAGIRGLWFG